MSYVVFLVYNAIVLFLTWYTINRCLEPKYRLRTIWLIEAGSIVLQMLAGILSAIIPAVDSIRTPVIAVCYLLPVFFLYKDKILRRLLVMICVYFAVILTEIIVYLLFPALTVNIHLQNVTLSIVWYYVFFICCIAIMLYLVYILLHKKTMGDIDRLSARQYWFFLIFPISQIFLIFGWYRSFGETLTPLNLVILTLYAVVCFVADVVWFREMSRIADVARMKAENDLLEKQAEVQREYYELLSSNYTDMSAMRHDIANHIYTIRVLLQDGKSEEAIRYAAELEQSRPAQSVLSSVKNSAVHSFLRHKLEELNEKDIRTEFDVSLTPGAGIPDTDLIIALGNLLDNAAEACAAAQEHTLHLKMSQKDGYIHIETENSCAAVPAPKKRKVAYLSRGIGTSILQSLAKQYNGSYTSANEGGSNHAILVLQENTPC